MSLRLQQFRFEISKIRRKIAGGISKSFLWVLKMTLVGLYGGENGALKQIQKLVREDAERGNFSKKPADYVSELFQKRSAKSALQEALEAYILSAHQTTEKPVGIDDITIYEFDPFKGSISFFVKIDGERHLDPDVEALSNERYQTNQIKRYFKNLGATSINVNDYILPMKKSRVHNQVMYDVTVKLKFDENQLDQLFSKQALQRIMLVSRGMKS